MHIDTLIRQLATETGIGYLQLNDEGRVGLLFVDRFAVDLEYVKEQETLYIFSEVGNPPAEGKEDFYARLLTANQPGQKISDATFSLDPANDMILLSTHCKLESLTFENFKLLMENFLEDLSHQTPLLMHPSYR